MIQVLTFEQHTICCDSYYYKTNTDLNIYIKNIIPKLTKSLHIPTIIVLGGDGTMLRAISQFYKENKPFLGINFGSYGFLLNPNIPIKNPEKFQLQNYPLLEVKYALQDTIYESVAFNEVNITVCDGKTLELQVMVGENSLALRGDGVLIATPAGSTAYNKSLYGPVLPHSAKNLIITPKADMYHTKPVIIPENCTISVKNTHRLNPIEIYTDSAKLGKKIDGEQVQISIKKSDYSVQFLIFDETKVDWQQKIYEAQGFQNG